MKKVSVKSADKKNNILLVAERLFSEHGYAATSTRMLAAEAGVNLGMLTYYFGSKDAILRELINQKIGFYKDSFAVIEKLTIPSIEKAYAIIDLYIDHMTENASFHRILNTEILTSKPDSNTEYIYSLVHQNSMFVTRIIEQGIKKKEFRKDCDAKLFMPTVVGLILMFVKNEYFMLRFFGQDEKEFSNFRSKYIARLRSYLKDLALNYFIIK